MKHMNSAETKIKLPTIGKKQLDLLEKLSNVIAVSGDEGNVRKIVLEEITPYVSEINTDALGNVIAYCKSEKKNAPKVLVTAHMDEVGFMVVDEEEGGYYKFEIVGAIDPRFLPGKTVLVGDDRTMGIIGVKPIHLTTEAERKNAFKVDEMRFDVGPDKKKKVKIGDRASFGTKFLRMGPSISGKALDNRLGVATLIELVKNAPYEVDLIAGFTVQEEIGQRGARVVGYSTNPDAAIAIDSTPSYDMPARDQEENISYNTKLGCGPALYIADSYTFSDPRLFAFIVQQAESNKISIQIRQPGGGGTDAGTIHKTRGGVPSLSISIPQRFPHSPVQLARIKDWQDTLQLVYRVLNSFTNKIFETAR
jgi:tetrahedral aminopeptidase